VTLMDEELGWIRLVPNSTSRRLISLRSQFHPINSRLVLGNVGQHEAT
jgi:hypothetical protein